MKLLINLYHKFLETGTQKNLSFLDNRYIRLTNFVNLCTVFLISVPGILLVLTFTDYGFNSYLRLLLLIIVALFNVFLNFKRQYLTSKFLTVISPFFFIFVFPILNDTVKEGMFFWYYSGIMAIGVISFYVFSYEKERVYMNLCLLFFIFSSVLFDSFLMNFKGPDVDLSFIFKSDVNYFHFKIPRILIVLFLYASFYKMKIDYYKTQLLIIKMNEKLDQANRDLQLLNSDLENKVQDRTNQLNLQNKRIKELAYTNSHIIRTYVARIIGLVNITEEPDVNQEDLGYCYRKIKEDSIRLDDVTRKLSNELITEE